MCERTAVLQHIGDSLRPPLKSKHQAPRMRTSQKMAARAFKDSQGHRALSWTISAEIYRQEVWCSAGKTRISFYYLSMGIGGSMMPVAPAVAGTLRDAEFRVSGEHRKADPPARVFSQVVCSSHLFDFVELPPQIRVKFRSSEKQPPSFQHEVCHFLSILVVLH